MTDPKKFEWLGGLIQTTDTLFPSGGYAHSYGLEEMVALGKVQSIQDLEDFLMQEILPSLEKLELPYLRYSVEAVEQNDLEDLAKINEEISAWKLTREIRDAGSSQGAQLLRMILELYQCPISKKFKQLLHDRSDQCQQITATALLRNVQKAPIESTMMRPQPFYRFVERFFVLDYCLLGQFQISQQILAAGFSALQQL